jgi:probable HAF family extracellular repeat protein
MIATKNLLLPLAVASTFTLALVATDEAAAGPTPAAAQVTLPDGYEIVDLATPSGKVSYGLALGTTGRVGGGEQPKGSNNSRAITWSISGEATYPTWGGDLSVAVGVLPDGSPVGYARQLGLYQGYKGTAVLAGIPLGVGYGGKIVGYKLAANKTEAWTEPSMPLKSVAGYTDAGAYDSNASNTVVGYASNGTAMGTPTRAVRWAADGTPTLLPGKGPLDQGAAFAVSDKNVVVGHVGANADQRGARWDGGQLTELGTLGGATGATAVNNAGTIVGWSKDAGGHLHGVIFRNNKAVDVNTLIGRPALTRAPAAGGLIDRQQVLKNEWIVQTLSAVDDKGTMCGYAWRATGEMHGVILRPVTRTVSVATLEEIGSSLHATNPPQLTVSRGLRP